MVEPTPRLTSPVLRRFMSMWSMITERNWVYECKASYGNDQSWRVSYTRPVTLFISSNNGLTTQDPIRGIRPRILFQANRSQEMFCFVTQTQGWIFAPPQYLMLAHFHNSSDWLRLVFCFLKAMSILAILLLLVRDYISGFYWPRYWNSNFRWRPRSWCFC